MILILHPQRRDDSLEVIARGDALFINGQEFDFSPIPDGGRLPQLAIDSEWISGDVERSGDQIRVPLCLPLGMNPSHEAAYPAPVHVTEDGPVRLPT